MEREGPAAFDSRAILRRPAAGSDARSSDEKPRRAADEPATVDAVAGSEFVDDRIRLRE
jgi:hypothetical protein